MRLAASIAVTMLFFVTPLISAQESKDQLSGLEEFLEISGALVQKEFIKVGTIQGCAISVVVFTDLNDSTSTKGIKLSATFVSSLGSTTQKMAFLDSDEIDGLIMSLHRIEQVIKTSPANHTEIVHTSRTGFSAGSSFKTKKKPWLEGKWSVFMKLKRFDKKSFVKLKLKQLPELIELLTKTKQTLAQY